MLRSLARLTHPRGSGLLAQVAVLLAAVVAGLAIGAVLVKADERSWDGARTTSATVLGLEDDGIHAQAGPQEVVLHLERVPAPGTELPVEVAPDGRARPASYRQTWGGAVTEGLALAVGLAALVQVYRWFVTRRPVASAA